MPWRVKWTQHGPCRWIKRYPSVTRDGEQQWHQMKNPVLEILLWETSSDSVRPLRITRNEIGDYHFKIIHPDSVVPIRHFKFDGSFVELPETEVRKIEPESYHTLKLLRQRLLAMGGPDFTREVCNLFYGEFE